jgi:hypothetical protein
MNPTKEPRDTHYDETLKEGNKLALVKTATPYLESER